MQSKELDCLCIQETGWISQTQGTYTLAADSYPPFLLSQANITTCISPPKKAHSIHPIPKIHQTENEQPHWHLLQTPPNIKGIHPLDIQTIQQSILCRQWVDPSCLTTKTRIFTRTSNEIHKQNKSTDQPTEISPCSSTPDNKWHSTPISPTRQGL